MYETRKAGYKFIHDYLHFVAALYAKFHGPLIAHLIVAADSNPGVVHVAFDTGTSKSLDNNFLPLPLRSGATHRIFYNYVA